MATREPFVVAPWDEDEHFILAQGCFRAAPHPDDDRWWGTPVSERRCFLNPLGPEQAIDHGWGKGGVWFAERPDTLVDPSSFWRAPDLRSGEEFGRPGGKYEFSKTPETPAAEMLTAFVFNDVI